MSEALVTLSGASEPTVAVHVELLPSDAAILADYKRWMHRRDYRQELYCTECWSERNSRKVEPTEINIATSGELGIICPHKLTLFHGRVPLSQIAESASDAKPKGLLIAHLGAEIPTVRLEPWEAELLRSYKAVLTRHRYLEALRCGKCFAKGNSDGCKAIVTDSGVSIECRCRHAVYKGLSS